MHIHPPSTYLHLISPRTSTNRFSLVSSLRYHHYRSLVSHFKFAVPLFPFHSFDSPRRLCTFLGSYANPFLTPILLLLLSPSTSLESWGGLGLERKKRMGGKDFVGRWRGGEEGVMSISISQSDNPLLPSSSSRSPYPQVIRDTHPIYTICVHYIGGNIRAQPFPLMTNVNLNRRQIAKFALLWLRLCTRPTAICSIIMLSIRCSLILCNLWCWPRFWEGGGGGLATGGKWHWFLESYYL